MARKFVVVSTNGNPPFKEMWQVHKEGCRDLPRLTRFYRCDTHTTEAENGEAVALWWMDEELLEMGYTHDDVRVMPCTK